MKISSLATDFNKKKVHSIIYMMPTSCQNTKIISTTLFKKCYRSNRNESRMAQWRSFNKISFMCGPAAFIKYQTSKIKIIVVASLKTCLICFLPPTSPEVIKDLFFLIHLLCNQNTIIMFLKFLSVPFVITFTLIFLHDPGGLLSVSL